MGRIVINAGEQTWRRVDFIQEPIQELIQEPRKTVRRNIPVLSFAPFMIGSYIGLPQMDTVLFGVVLMALVAMTITGGGSDSSNFIQELLDEIEDLLR